jgi:gluconate kinase
VISTRVQRYLFSHYTPETLLNPVFEDLRKPKAPNMKEVLYIKNMAKSIVDEVVNKLLHEVAKKVIKEE